MFVTHAPGDRDRLFIAQRGGSIRILDLNTGVLQTTPFLSTTVDTNGEGGFLGLAFHPDYFNEGQPGFGKFYVDVTTGSPVYDSRTRVHGFGGKSEFGERGLIARDYQCSAYRRNQSQRRLDRVQS